MQGALLNAVADNGEQLALPDGTLHYFPAFYPPEQSLACFQRLLKETLWQQDTLNFGGRAVAVPRLQAWYGDAETHYGYSGLRLTPHPWTPLLTTLREDLQQRLSLPFNSVLLNYYRDGQDSVAWHSDDERKLGPDPQIASLSFGTSRRFELKHKQRRDLKKMTIDLDDGSLLVMGSGVQQHWSHQVPKEPAVTGARLNLTFRFIHAMA
ncbi:MAG: alpha-ketoglutarate-dependent dioxygenase AlkB [Pseudomonadota bacterium]